MRAPTTRLLKATVVGVLSLWAIIVVKKWEWGLRICEIFAIFVFWTETTIMLQSQQQQHATTTANCNA
jgi:hypothetical protein